MKKKEIQKIDDLIDMIQVVISKNRCLCSDSTEDVLKECIRLLQESKVRMDKKVTINWELVLKALGLLAELYIHADLFTHLL